MAAAGVHHRRGGGLDRVVHGYEVEGGVVRADPLLAGIRAALAVGSVDAEVVAIEARKVAERTVAPVVPIGALSRYDRPKPTLNG